MVFESLPEHLYARLKAARADARATISDAELMAQQLREEARKNGALCPTDWLAMEHLKQGFNAAETLVQQAHEQVAQDLAYELVEIRRLAGQNATEIAQELESGVPAWIRDELISLIPMSPRLESVLKTAVDRLCHYCWQKASVHEIPLEPRRGHGIASDVVGQLSEPENGGTRASTVRKSSTDTVLGWHLDRLRLECGWSLDDLARATGLDKKLIVGHVKKGKNAHPRTLAVYAIAFSKQLGRTVLVTELIE